MSCWCQNSSFCFNESADSESQVFSSIFSPANLATHSAACLYSTISRRLGRIQRDFLTFHGLSGLSLTFGSIFSTFKFLLLLGTTGWSIRTQHFGSAFRVFRIVAYFAISLWPLQSRVHCAFKVWYKTSVMSDLLIGQ